MSSRGYGFINVEDSEKDIFFHMSNFPPRELPVQDQVVEFEIKETPKGKEAVSIKIVGDKPEEKAVPEVSEKTPVKVKEKAPAKVKEEAPVKKDAKPASSETHGLGELSGVGPKYKALLEKAKIKTCEDLAAQTTEKLLAKLLAVNEKAQITKRPPTEAKVKEWIEKASEVVA